MSRVSRVFARRQNMSLHAVRFRFDGEPVREVDTPETMSMEDGDAIEVFQQQTGGCGSSREASGDPARTPRPRWSRPAA